MSSQQRMRPNVSPSTKPGPLKATVPVALMRQGSSPTNKKNSPTDSPTFRLPQGLRINRQSPPENRINVSPERKYSPIAQSERSKTLNLRSGSNSVVGGLSPVIRRTASLETLHLGPVHQQQQPSGASQLNPAALVSWTREVAPNQTTTAALLSHTYCGRLMVDRATQTPEDWDETEKKKSQKKSSDSLEMRFMRQRLQRTSAVGGRVLSPQHQYQHQQQHSSSQSQVHRQGHLLIGGSSIATGMGNTLPPTWTSSVSPSTLGHPQNTLVSTPLDSSCSSSSSGGGGGSAIGTGGRTIPIPIPHIPKPLVPRLRNSVEGLNQEIERLVLKETSAVDSEGPESDKGSDHALDGHRAPIAKLLHCHQLPQTVSYHGTSSVDTQTPSGGRGCSGGRVESSSSGGGSPSPPLPLPLLPIPGHHLTSPPSNGDKSASPEYSRLSSKYPNDPSPPRIEPFLAREPPDGCEKVKVIEEPYKQPASSLSLVELNKPMQGAPVLKENAPRPCMNFVLMPSQRSAFCPLYKPYLPPSSIATASTAHAVSTTSSLANKTQISPSTLTTTFNEKLQ